MNFVRMYEFGLITFEELSEQLWNFGQNAIYELGESCFKFYIDKANKKHNYIYYIERLNNYEVIDLNSTETEGNQDDPFDGYL